MDINRFQFTISTWFRDQSLWYVYIYFVIVSVNIYRRISTFADVLFLESPEVIFKVAIALLDVHKDELLRRDNFEEIMDYIKNVIPQVDAVTLDRIMKDVFTMDIRKQLSEYHVEYNVLQEEITTTNHHLENLNREKEANHHLETQLQVTLPFSTSFFFSKQNGVTITISIISVCSVQHCTARKNEIVPTESNSVVTVPSAKFGSDGGNPWSISFSAHR